MNPRLVRFAQDVRRTAAAGSLIAADGAAERNVAILADLAAEATAVLSELGLPLEAHGEEVDRAGDQVSGKSEASAQGEAGQADPGGQAGEGSQGAG